MAVTETTLEQSTFVPPDKKPETISFTISHAALTAALALANRVTSKRTPLPILQFVLIQAKDGVFSVSATDMEQWITIPLPPDDVMESTPGATTVKASDLAALVKSLNPQKPVHAYLDARKNYSRLTVTSGDTVIHLPVLPADEFPTLKQEHEGQFAFHVDGNDFRKAISHTVFATGSDITKPVVLGIGVMQDEKLFTCYGFDGFRAARYRWDRKTHSETDDTFSVVIPSGPARTIAELLKQDSGTASFTFYRNFQRLTIAFGNGTEFTTAMVDAPAIQINQLIPKQQETTAMVNRRELSAAIHRAQYFGTNEYRSVRVVFGDDMLIIHTPNEMDGSSFDVIKDVVRHGPELATTIDANKIISVIDMLDAESIVIGGTTPKSPFSIRTPDIPEFDFIVMPIETAG
jgi:DNA polymerase-3 subunit beta